jgi:hypothetical protein
MWPEPAPGRAADSGLGAVHAAGSTLDIPSSVGADTDLSAHGRSLRGARGVTTSRTARPLDERCGGDPDVSIRIAQGRQLAARDKRADAGDRQPQPTGRLGQGECGPPVDPPHRSTVPATGGEVQDLCTSICTSRWGVGYLHFRHVRRCGRPPIWLRRRGSGRRGSADRGSDGCGDWVGRGGAASRLVRARRPPSRPPGKRGLFRRSTASS